MDKAQAGNDAIDDQQSVINMNDHEFRQAVVHQFRLGRDAMNELRAQIDENTALTKENIASTAELVEIFRTAKTGVSVFTWSGRNLRKFVTWIYPFALLGGTIAAIWHGKWPKWGE